MKVSAEARLLSAGGGRRMAPSRRDRHPMDRRRPPPQHTQVPKAALGYDMVGATQRSSAPQGEVRPAKTNLEVRVEKALGDRREGFVCA